MKVDLKEMIREHKKLVKVLKGSNRKEHLSEARKQELELKEYNRKLNKDKKIYKG